MKPGRCVVRVVQPGLSCRRCSGASLDMYTFLVCHLSATQSEELFFKPSLPPAPPPSQLSQAQVCTRMTMDSGVVVLVSVVAQQPQSRDEGALCTYIPNFRLCFSRQLERQRERERETQVFFLSLSLSRCLSLSLSFALFYY